MAATFPLVSVLCLVYNHEKFLTETIKGFLNQKTNFVFEVVIHDDASTDNSADIIRKFEKEYPDLFKPIYQKVNQHSIEVGRISRIIFSAANGKYSAFCEGDDYWTDPYKLQKQVDFLEANPDYSMSGHRVAIYKEESKKMRGKSPKNKSTLYAKDIITGASVPTLSMVFRTKFIKDLPDIYYKAPVKDLFLKIHLSTKGKAIFFNEIMGVYRSHPGGITKINLLEWKNKEVQTNIILSTQYPQYASLFEMELLKLKARLIGYKNAKGIKKDSNELINDYSFFKSLLFQYKILKSTVYYFLSSKKII